MKLTGFTLFFNPGKQSWQMSIRTDSEDGWSVNHISDEQAQEVFRLLESQNAVHGCGPWVVHVLVPEQPTLEETVKKLTEVICGMA